MFSISQKLRFFSHQRRWRKARKRGKTLRLRIGNVAEFLKQLNEKNIPYVVLRWFDEVPLTPENEAQCTEDIDFLIDHTRLPEVVELASQHRGNIKCDFYSPAGKRGTGYKKMPYYPPIMAEDVLAHRVMYQGSFYIPSPEYHFKSLAYHLTYHKATTSGISSGVETITADPDDLPAKRPYGQHLEELANSLNPPIEPKILRPFSLINLHHHLQQSGWAMPYDLMVRWPKERSWMRYLAESEEAIFRPYAENDPELVVFLIRADATESDAIKEATIAHIAKHFNILQSKPLDRSASERVMRNVRGGNWVEHRGTVLIPPTLALICRDNNPEPFAKDDPRRKKYPFISNAKVLLKNDIRDSINREFPDTKEKRIVLHASDNALETQHHLQAVYGEQYPGICGELLVAGSQ